ncbi:response regulator transcription factor [Paenibacillus contaminans]|uniref:DNA-binding response regulator n=1 Tax=Paenibacillus contaminans TaxID=450362 RepID=A0A329M755_9BACL|nr:response regulator transcription factor [Paenibacillus contaminans]RAV15578.1 DNA-binding response regulator [Paenibacillus contaminans]
MKIDLLLVEDDPVWRKMLARFLDNEPDLRVIQAVGTKEEAVAYCANNKVDVVLMDINLTGNNLDGIEATLELNLMKSPAKVIALTSLDREDVIIDTYTAGAVHYISKSDFRKIPETIRSVFHTVSPQEILVKDYIRLKEAEQYNKLTLAEREIVALSEEGIGRTQMIDKLGKSEGTLKNQISHILRKFKAKSLKEVIRTVKSRGLGSRESDR